MDDFYKLLNKYRIDGTFCDVALWAKCPTNPENVMGPYSAHKVVLAATCPSLASVMTSQNIALDAADSETMPVLLSWVYGQRDQAAKSITSQQILQRVKYLAKCLGMKSFMTFLSTVGINNGSPPSDGLKPEVHPILEKRSNQSTKRDIARNNNNSSVSNGGGNNNAVNNAGNNAVNDAVNNAGNNAVNDAVNNSPVSNDENVGSVNAPPATKGSTPRNNRTSIGNVPKSQNAVKQESRPNSQAPLSQKENQSNNARLPETTKETRPANKTATKEDESDIDLTDGSPEAGSSQEADSTTEENGNDQMSRRKRGQKDEQPISPVKRKRESSEDNNNKQTAEEIRSTPQMRNRVETKISTSSKLSNLKLTALPDKIAKPSPKPSAPSNPPSQPISPSVNASGKNNAYGWSASWNQVDMNKLKIPEDTTKYPFKKVREATVSMTCYCHICGKMKSGKDLKSHYEKIHAIELKDSYQVICLVEKAEDFLQKCKWVALKDLTAEMALDLVCGVCYVNKSGKKLLFKHLKEKHDVDVNEQNPDLELLVEKKMWEIDMESVTESNGESTGDLTTTWVKFADAAPNGSFQCHECDKQIGSKKSLKIHLSTLHNKDIEEDGSVLQVQRGAPNRKRRSTMGVRDLM